MIALLKLGGGLLLLIVANIALGSISALMNKEWNWTIFRNGLIKGGIVIGAFIVVYIAGWLNPDLVIVEIDGQTVNLAMGVYSILLIGFTYYAGKVLLKLKEIVTTKSAAEYKKYDIMGKTETNAGEDGAAIEPAEKEENLKEQETKT